MEGKFKLPEEELPVKVAPVKVELELLDKVLSVDDTRGAKVGSA
jgi:hypothetical protein